MADTDYDLVIIGGGPAGLTAGLYAARARLDTLLIEKTGTGGQVLVTDWVENYPGFPDGIKGVDLVKAMTDQAVGFGLKIEDNTVLSLELSEKTKSIRLADDKVITCKAIIIATGASPKKLGVPGEDKFFGRGISSCATCDGPFCKGRVVAAVGGGDTAVQESIFLTKFAEKVYLIHRRDEFRAAKILRERAIANDKIEIVYDSVLTQINGLFNLENIVIKNVKNNETKTLKVDMLFIWIGITPNIEFLDDSVPKDEYGFIVTGPDMACEKIPGLFAAGDVRSTPLRQIVTAVSDGAVAAFSAEHYIESMKK